MKEIMFKAIGHYANPPADKFAALLSNSRKFRQSWEHNRTDLGNPTASGYDLSLAMQAAYAGWTEKEIISLVIAHRREHGDIEKLEREHYLGQLLQYVKTSNDAGYSEIQAIESAQWAYLKDLSKEDKIAKISAVLGVNIDGMIKRGMDPAEYYFVIKGKQVSIGGVFELMSPKAVRAVLFEATGHITPMRTLNYWDGVLRLMTDIFEIDDVGGGRPEETMELIQEFIEILGVYKEEEKSEALFDRQPFDDGDKLWIFLPKLHFYVTKSRALPNISRRKLKNRLLECGFEHKVHNSRLYGTVVCRSYWGIQSEKLKQPPTLLVGK